MQSTEPSRVYTGRMSPVFSRQNTWEALRMVAVKYSLSPEAAHSSPPPKRQSLPTEEPTASS